MLCIKHLQVFFGRIPRDDSPDCSQRKEPYQVVSAVTKHGLPHTYHTWAWLAFLRDATKELPSLCSGARGVTICRLLHTLPPDPSTSQHFYAHCTGIPTLRQTPLALFAVRRLFRRRKSRRNAYTKELRKTPKLPAPTKTFASIRAPLKETAARALRLRRYVRIHTFPFRQP